jgi:hypothetical protein
MAQSNGLLKKRVESTSDRFEEKGKRVWAYAKNGMGRKHYEKAQDAFGKAKINREKLIDYKYF